MIDYYIALPNLTGDRAVALKATDNRISFFQGGGYDSVQAGYVFSRVRGYVEPKLECCFFGYVGTLSAAFHLFLILR